jgi:hypothetical protein
MIGDFPIQTIKKMTLYCDIPSKHDYVIIAESFNPNDFAEIAKTIELRLEDSDFPSVQGCPVPQPKNKGIHV